MTSLKRTFLEYNALYFAGQLPTDATVVWSTKLQGAAGDFDGDATIRIHSALKPFDSVWRETLLHEMAHLATASEEAEHGPKWHREMRRLYRIGALAKVW